jgi:hypothetical protein
MQCDLSLLVMLQAAFMDLSHARASSCSIFTSPASKHRTQLQRADHEPVRLVPEWTIACLCLPGLFESALTYILRAFYSAVIGINTASYDASCKEPTCFVPEHVASSVYRFDPGSASDPFTADSLQYVSTQPAPVVIQHECVHLKFLYAYETPTCLPTHFAVTLSMYTLLLTIYRALLKRCSFSVEKSIANSCVRARLAYS